MHGLSKDDIHFQHVYYSYKLEFSQFNNVSIKFKAVLIKYLKSPGFI